MLFFIKLYIIFIKYIIFIISDNPLKILYLSCFTFKFDFKRQFFYVIIVKGKV